MNSSDSPRTIPGFDIDIYRSFYQNGKRVNLTPTDPAATTIV